MKSKILLCISIMFISKLELSTAKVQGPHHHPIYKYSCNEDLSVTFKGVNGTVEYFSKVPNTNVDCNITEIPKHKGKFNIPKGCLSPKEFNVTRTMTVAVYDKNENETKNLQKNPLVSGGYHIFEITCLPLELVGVERIALAETGITDIEQLHNVYNEIGQVEMRFKEDESYDSPDLSEVYIGDIFYMYLKYMGDTRQYIIMPQLCTAYRGTFRIEDTNGQMDLWTYKDKSADCLTDNAKRYNVMKNFKRLNSTILHAEVLGFRFSSNLDSTSSDVTISCTVKICTSATGPCASSCGIEKVSNRRKRETGTIRSQTVSKTLKVRNKKFDSNDAGRTSFSVGIVGIITASILFHILYE